MILEKSKECIIFLLKKCCNERNLWGEARRGKEWSNHQKEKGKPGIFFNKKDFRRDYLRTKATLCDCGREE